MRTVGTDERETAADDIGAELESTVYLVKRLQLVLQALMDAELRKFATTPLQYTVMSILDRTPRPSADLARATFLTAQTMHRLVLTLERRGVVTREPDPRSRRSRLVTLTPFGRELLTRCHPAVRKLEDLLRNSLPAGESACFRDSLRAGTAAMAAHAASKRVEVAA